MEKPPIKCWGVEAPVEPLPGGHRNRAFRTRGLKFDFVFKTTRREPAAIEWLLPVFDLAKQSGFIVPRPIKSKNNRYVEEGWTCEAFLQGKMFRTEDVSQIAAPLLLFQQATKQIPQRPGFLSAAAFMDHEIGGDIDLRLLPADLVALCRASFSRIAAKPKSVVHGDLNATNMIWNENGQIAILDWDEARVDASLFDGLPAGIDDAEEASRMAILAWEVACSWTLEPDYASKMAAELVHHRYLITDSFSL